MRMALPAFPSLNAALEAGVDSIEHGSFLDARSLELFIAKGAFHVPTIIAGVTVLEMAPGRRPVDDSANREGDDRRRKD
jgi:imidazolonepropionase-like amidohydrolase